jgi:hypothetical protein
MGYTRVSATTHLANELAKLAAETGQVLTDSAAGFGPAIDRALRTLGVAEASLATTTVDDDDVPAYLALCEYHALARIWRALATRADVSARNVMGPRAQVFQHVKDLMEMAANECAALGYPVGSLGASASGGSWNVGSLTLDFIEPVDPSALP